jgi:hypothetical protein
MPRAQLAAAVAAAGKEAIVGERSAVRRDAEAPPDQLA